MAGNAEVSHTHLTRRLHRTPELPENFAPDTHGSVVLPAVERTEVGGVIDRHRLERRPSLSLMAERWPRFLHRPRTWRDSATDPECPPEPDDRQLRIDDVRRLDGL